MCHVTTLGCAREKDRRKASEERRRAHPGKKNGVALAMVGGGQEEDEGVAHFGENGTKCTSGNSPDLNYIREKGKAGTDLTNPTPALFTSL